MNYTQNERIEQVTDTTSKLWEKEIAEGIICIDLRIRRAL